MPKIPDGLRADLAKAVAQESVTFGHKKSWQVASQTLRADEKVIVATEARRVEEGKNDDWGVLIISDQRLLFVHAGEFATEPEEIPLNHPGFYAHLPLREGWPDGDQVRREHQGQGGAVGLRARR